ncbi:hypothetical protein [Carnobacterium sp. TMP28]|uniref:hypothetical protein n=1 Tax=Carnobacterium sp. TMP28 TaxID=3397060 RepID=UPI0039DFE324
MKKDTMVYHDVRNDDELLEALRKREFYILIKGEYNDKVKKLVKTKLTDDELIGVELGSGGSLSLFSELIYLILNLFSKQSRIDKKLESKIRQYNFKLDNDKNLLLYLRQLDY